MSIKKSSKRLIISTQAKNGHGFRTRTAGIDLSEFNNNPLLLWMHKRPTGESTSEILPLGYWDDVQLNGEELSGVPCFDSSDAFAMKIYNKVENGTIRMASAGLKPKENGLREENDELWLWDSVLFEASICDIGSNKEALAVSLYNEDGEVITLSEIYKKPKIEEPMSKIKLSAGAAVLLSATAGAEMEAEAVVSQLTTLAEGLKEKNVTLTADKQTAEDALATEKAKTAKVEKEALLNEGVTKGKITADEKPILLKLELEDLKVYLSKKPEQASVASQLKGGKGVDEKLLTLSYDELRKDGKLALLKEQDFESYALKFEERFGKKPTA